MALKVVVIGGGFGGLEAVSGLKNADVEITLIDRKNHHCFQPLLYQVATAALSPADVAWPIRSLLANQENARTVMAEVTRVDVIAKRVTAGDQQFDFDELIVASGATHSYFSHPEWSQMAPGLKTVEDATLIRSRILRQFENAELLPSGSDQDAALTFVVIGGGPTGVELAGAIAEISRTILSKDFRRISARTARVHLVEAGSRILPQFEPELSDYAADALKRLGVTLHLNDPVEKLDEASVLTTSGLNIRSKCVLWAAGVRASPAGEWLSAVTDRSGRIFVNSHLKVQGHENVYAIGDVATVEGNSIPWIAPAAKQMGQCVAKAIKAKIEGKAISPFQYNHHGDLATIGRRLAVVKIGRLRLKGFIGWLAWSVGHIYFLITARSRLIVSINWLWEYLTLQRGARLINRD